MAVVADNVFDESYNVASHGLALWDVIRKTGAAAHAKAQANSEANAGANTVELVTEVVDANNYKALGFRGARVKLPSGHGLVGTFGDPIWLSPSTAGLMTLTKPTGAADAVFYLGYLVDSTTIFWGPWPFIFSPSEAP